MPRPSSPAPSGPALDSPHWFCLRARPKTEHMAARQLAQSSDDVSVFCPLLRFRRNTRRGRVWFQEALFPGYFSPDLFRKPMRGWWHTARE